jgi:hypothetical protein
VPTARVVALDGSPRSEELVLDSGYATGAVDDGLVFGTGGRIFVLDREGTTRAVGVGEPYAASGHHVVARTCDDRARCAVGVIDLTTGATSVLDVDLPSARFGLDVTLSPLGELAIWQYGPIDPQLFVGTLDGGIVDQIRVPNFGGGRLQWLPQRQGLLVVGEDGLRVQRVVIEGDELVRHPIPALSEGGAQTIVVIPP